MTEPVRRNPMPPAPKGRLLILSKSERRALMLACDAETRVVMPGNRIGRLEISYRVAEELLLSQPKLLATVQRTHDDPSTAAIVTATDRGRIELARPQPHTPTLLTYAARPRGTEHGVTDRTEEGMRDEPERVEGPDLAHVHATERLRTLNEYRDIRRTLIDAITALQNGPGSADRRVAKEIRHMRARLARIDSLLRQAA